MSEMKQLRRAESNRESGLESSLENSLEGSRENRRESGLESNRKNRLDRGNAAVIHIKSIYQQMIHSGTGEADLRSKLAVELLGVQRDDGSWSTIDDDRAPVDIRVDFVYVPTFYATAALMFRMTADGISVEEKNLEMSLEKNLKKNSEGRLAVESEGNRNLSERLSGRLTERLSECLAAGLRVAGARKLNGHGFEATRQKMEALAIYREAGMYSWMREYGDQFPEFSGMIREIIEGFRLAIATGRTFSDWNEDFSDRFRKEVEAYESEMIPDVWYAAYGSNISRERFMRYIERCTDRTAPREDRSFELPWDIYFAGRKKNWDNKGTAFLNDSKEGMALGRVYRITRKQFAEIQHMEGPDYTRKLALGMLEDIPVYTFTTKRAVNAPKWNAAAEENVRAVSKWNAAAEENAQALPEQNVPSARYLQTILTGLRETYPEKSELVLQAYLFSRVAFDETDRSVLQFVRRSEHGVTLQTIADETMHGCITPVRKAVKKLLACGLLRQDSRSVRAGHDVDDREAVVYTSKEHRDFIDLWMVL